MFVGNFDHIHAAIKPEIGTRHGKRRAPLSRARFCRNPFQTLRFRIIRLRDRGIKLVASTRVVALEFIINLGRGIKRLFQSIRAHVRRRAVHFIKVPYFLRDLNIRRSIVQFLPRKLFTKDLGHLRLRHGVQRSGV